MRRGVVDMQDDDFVSVIVDVVSHAVLTSSGTP